MNVAPLRQLAPPRPTTPFVPHPLVRGPHLQTLAGAYLPGERLAYRARQRQVPLDDGDALVLHDDQPDSWRPGDRAALLLHGLAGCHLSPYMQRIAAKMAARGARVFRMDLRGAGAGADLAKRPYHSGLSDDAAAALEFIARLCPDSPTSLVGFSLGANIALKLLGELGEASCGGLDRAVVVSPPVDLAACCERLARWPNTFYDRHFVRLLRRHVRRGVQTPPRPAAGRDWQSARRLRDFDDAFTAPLWGFGSAENYYRQCSSGAFAARVRRPTLVLAAEDDPLVPGELVRRVAWPSCAQLLLSRHGGHLGFVARTGLDPDCRWMDWRVVEGAMGGTAGG